MKRVIMILLLLGLMFGCEGGTEEEERKNLSGGSGSVGVSSGGADYIGTWMRTGTYTNGDLMHQEPATMILTKNTFDSSSKACGNSGSIDVDGAQVVMVVEKSDCPSIITVGSKVTYTYKVEGSKMEILNTEYGAAVMETYQRK
ncbi:hypothetical protein ACFL0V_04705 [Nanoarchaeota archaeon]